MIAASSSGTAPCDDSAVDPVTVEVIRRKLVSITDQVDANISRTAFNPYIYEYKDYAVGIVDAAGNVMSQCTAGIPIFVADVLGAAVRDGLAIYGPTGFHEGDVIFTNYAGTVGQHLNNVVMYTPIFSPAEHDLVGFMMVVVHWIDVGGREIGSVSTHATDIFQEGIQFRTVKLLSEGKRVEEMYRMIRHNTRFPDSVLGDIEAQVGGCLLGRNEVVSLLTKYGLQIFRHSLATIWSQSEKAARRAIREIPDGEYSASAFLDDDGFTNEPIPQTIKVVVAGDALTIDLSGVSGQTRAPMNSGHSGGGQTVARVAYRYLIVPEGDVNEGSFRPLSVVLPEGKIVSSGPTAPMGFYNVPLPTLIDLVVKALSAAIPEKVAAGHFGTIATLRFAGKRPETGAFFQCHDSGFGGWGAILGEDGPGPFRTMCHGDTRLIPVEMQEALYPLMIEEFCLRTDSGGAGEFRGGLGLLRTYLLKADCTLVTRFERTKFPAWGVHGGKDGAPGSVTVFGRDGTSRPSLKDSLLVQAGDRVVVHTGGGGGFGSPKARSREKVRHDVIEGYVSSTEAERAYGHLLE